MNVSELVKTINHATTQNPTPMNESERVNLVAACDSLKNSLESLLEATIRFLFGVLRNPHYS